MSQFQLLQGDCLELMRTLPDNSVDAVVTDPPYGIRFMGKAWDGADIDQKHRQRKARGVACLGSDTAVPAVIAAEAGKYSKSLESMRAFQQFSEDWAREALRVLKPGGYLLSFSSPRTYHRMVCGIEDAGFEIRDCIQWVFGSGFPKNLDISKAIDKVAGAQREVVGLKNVGNGNARGEGFNHEGGTEGVPVTAPATDEAKAWDGWGTALKPAHEPIVMARKPLVGTVADNVLQFGTGGINIGDCRIPAEIETGWAGGATGGGTAQLSPGKPVCLVLSMDVGQQTLFTTAAMKHLQPFQTHRGNRGNRGLLRAMSRVHHWAVPTSTGKWTDAMNRRRATSSTPAPPDSFIVPRPAKPIGTRDANIFRPSSTAMMGAKPP